MGDSFQVVEGFGQHSMRRESKLNIVGALFLLSADGALLMQLRDEKPNEIFCLIIGMDSFIQFKSWKQWSEFFNYAHVVVLGRPGYEANNLTLTSFEATQNKQRLAEHQSGLLYFSNCPLIDVSSSEIRGKIAANKNLSDFLPKTIINYIKNNDA